MSKKNNVMGRSGRDIIQAILSGERNAQRLASLVQPGVKASAEETAEAQRGDWREEYLFELRQCFEFYEYCHQKIKECDNLYRRQLTGKASTERKQKRGIKRK
jgi:hypothetical protein